MYYNVTFFFEKPLSFFTTSEETPYTVSQEDYNLYLSGNYVRGTNQKPLLITPEYEEVIKATLPDSVIEDTTLNEGSISEFETNVMTALAELGETLASIMEGMNNGTS